MSARTSAGPQGPADGKASAHQEGLWKAKRPQPPLGEGGSVVVVHEEEVKIMEDFKYRFHQNFSVSFPCCDESESVPTGPVGLFLNGWLPRLLSLVVPDVLMESFVLAAPGSRLIPVDLPKQMHQQLW